MSLLTITPQELIPGDVCQFHGNSFVNEAIQLIDGGRHNHSCQWTGKSLATAETNGYVELSLEEAITESDQYVDCYRWCADPHHFYATQLGSKQYPYGPVLEAIQDRLKRGLKYNYPAILLLAIICEVRRLTNADIEERMEQDELAIETLKRIIDSSIILGIIEDAYSRGKELDICSQTVYANFLQAGEKYRMTILPESLHNSFVGTIIKQKIDSEILTKFKEVWSVGKVEPSLVTPHDIQMSPQLGMYLGRLKFGNLNTTELF